MNRSHSAAGRPDEGGQHLSHDVRIWALRVYEGRKAKTYSVRWMVAGQEHHQTFASRAMADSHRSELLSYVRKGVPFDRATGLPEPVLRQLHTRSWFEHACRYVDMKWPSAAPKSRKSIAETLTTVTCTLLSSTRGKPNSRDVREALYSWAFVSPMRQGGPPPDRFAATLTWLEHNTVSLADLQDRSRGAELTRAALDALATKLDGTPAAPNTVARRRAVFYNALEYAVELELLSSNPIDRVSWRTPKAAETVDRRSVVNPTQARCLLAAVAKQGEMGQRLKAFFGLMYYAAARPAEALGLRHTSLVDLPPDGWGELLLNGSTPRSGTAWSNTGASREDRGLKHRAANDTRPVPAHPELVALLHSHIERFGVGRDGRLFVGPMGGLMEESTYHVIWRKARAAAFTPAEAASPLAARPYDLRHAAVSTWLNAGVPPTQVAEWAGHSVAVLLRVYAKCIVGQDEAARKRIDDAMRGPGETPPDSPANASEEDLEQA